MYLLAAIPFTLALFWLVVVSLRLCAINARLRANLAGCAGYPISPSSRSLADRLSLGSSRFPLGNEGRAAERFGGVQ